MHLLLALLLLASPDAAVRSLWARLNPLAVVHTMGDSNTANSQATGGDWTSQAYRKFVGTALWRVYGVGGATITSLSAAAAANVDAYYADPGICVLLCGLNDACGSLSADSIEALASAWCVARRAVGWQVIVCTYPKDTLALGDFNDSLRANWSDYADGLADLGAAPYIGEAASHANLTYWYNSCHMTDAGLAIVADSVLKHVNLLAEVR